MTADRMRALEARLREIGARYSGTWTAAVTDLATGEHFGVDEDAVMPTASLIKVPILLALYQDVHAGRLKLADHTTYEEIHKCGGSGVLQHLAPGTRMTVRDAAMLMIIISDNAATNMCIDLVGLDRLNAAWAAAGYAQTAIYQWLGDRKAGLDARKMNVSSAGDICRIMTAIARHEAVTSELDEDMLRIMRRLNGRAELSHLLPWNEMNMLENPRENWVAEKGGAFINGIRTGGAVFHSARGSFAMAVFGEGMLAGRSDHESEGNKFLWETGKAAWDALAGF
jgi:beta-lactamase class A